ncbi:MAG: molybdate ABC transporter substrate-binding protein [Thermoleophilaceae bacterium]
MIHVRAPRSLRRRAVALLALAALACVAGCGSSETRPEIRVSAAASLRLALTRFGAQFQPARARYSFAGSDQLAAQIEHGARPDVYVSASLALPQALHAKGLVDRPRAFASNRRALSLPSDDTRMHGIGDLTAAGVTVAIGSRSVPIGSYTRAVLARLGPVRSRAILAHIRSEEPDVAGIVGKLSQRAVNAGFVYVTDVRAAHGALKPIDLPASLSPSVAYGIAVVRGAPRPTQARAFVAALLGGAGQRDLRDAGFGPPPPGK